MDDRQLVVGHSLYTTPIPPLPIPPLTFTGIALCALAGVLFIVHGCSAKRRRILVWMAWGAAAIGFLILYQDSPLAHWIENGRTLHVLVRRYGALIIFLFTFVEVIPPASFVSPGILLLIVAGSLVSTPGILLLFIAASTCGVVLGNALLFTLGRRYGHAIAHRFHLTGSRVQRVEKAMLRFGRFNIFVGQFIGIIRPGVAFVAGAAQMPPARYYPWMVASSIVWSSCYVSAGFLLHVNRGVLFYAIVGLGTIIYACGIFAIGMEYIAVGKRKTPDHT